MNGVSLLVDRCVCSGLVGMFRVLCGCRCTLVCVMTWSLEGLECVCFFGKLVLIG